MSSDFYGHLVELEPLEGATWKWTGSTWDPTWRYATVRRNADALILDLHAPDTTVVRAFEGIANQDSMYAIRPDGLLLAHYDPSTQTLTLHEDDQRRTLTIASTGGYLWFDATGQYLHLSTMNGGCAAVAVVDTTSLEVTSTLDVIELDTWRTDDTRIMSHGRPEFERLTDWQSVELIQEPWATDLVLLNIYYGDSFDGVACLRMGNGRIHQDHTDVLARHLSRLDGHVWSRVSVLPDIGLIAATDILDPIFRLPWPPVFSNAKPLAECLPLAFVDSDYPGPNDEDVCAQMFRDAPLREPYPVEILSVSPEHLLVLLKDDRYMIAIDPKTLGLLGIVRGHDDGPWYDLAQLGVDRFMACDDGTLRMWKLERT